MTTAAQRVSALFPAGYYNVHLGPPAIDSAFREYDIDDNSSVLTKVPRGPHEEFYWKIQRGTGLWTRNSCCFCMTPAMFIWTVNAIAFVGHSIIAATVLFEGLRSEDNLRFPVTRLVGKWHNATADGFTYTIETSPMVRLSLVWLCALFSILSATSHLLIVLATAFENAISRSYYESIYNCRIWWRWDTCTATCWQRVLTVLTVFASP